jgi:hypothetical protein
MNSASGSLPYLSLISELALLRRQGTVDEFSKWFIALSCCDTTLTEPQQVQLFITGLSDPLCTDGVLQQLATLDDVVIFVRAYEQRNTSRGGSTSRPHRPQARTLTR